MKILGFLFKFIIDFFLICFYALVAIVFFILEKIGLMKSNNSNNKDDSKNSKPNDSQPSGQNSSVSSKYRIFFPIEEDSKALEWAVSFGSDFHRAWKKCPEPEWLIYLAAGRGGPVKELIEAIHEFVNKATHPPKGIPDQARLLPFLEAGTKNPLTVADKAIDGGSSPEECMNAAKETHSEAISIYFGNIESAADQIEASWIQDVLLAIKFLLVALAEYIKAPKMDFVKKENVCEAFQIFSNDSDQDDTPGQQKQVTAPGKICLALAGAVASLKYDIDRQILEDILQKRHLGPVNDDKNSS